MNDSVYGIDLGTTYSAIARISDLGAAEIIANFEGDQTTPSVVYFEGPGRAIVGGEAKRVAVTDPDNACLLIKRQMGTAYPQEFQGEVYGPEAISALILKELVSAANQESGREITKVVITVPAYFGVQEREATSQAGQIAGLEVVGIVTEPVAAALSIGSRGDGPETVMVYDLGGGTFDTTIMTIGDGRVEVLAVDGNRKLGGADWDAALLDLIVTKFVAAANLGDDDPRHDEEFMIDLQLGAEEMKKSLTKRDTATIRAAYDGNKANIEVTRAEFEAATQHLIAQTVEISKRTVEIAEQKVADLQISRVLLVGGSSRMPMVKAALKDSLGWDAQDTDFDLAVAKGAAIYGQAAIEEVLNTGDQESPVEAGPDATPRPFFPGQAATLSVQNVLSRGIGVKLVRGADDTDGYVHFFAHANDTIPTSPDPLEAGTVVANQSVLAIGVYEQGGERESEVVADNRLLKEAELELPIKDLPVGSAIDIVVDISGEGIVTLKVTEPQSGNTLELTAAVSVLTAEQVGEETAKVSALTLRS
jgi:molecular chaperone DnaK